MCLALFAFEVSPSYPLVLAANRDEFYNRPTRPMKQWSEGAEILAGKDVSAGGTWLGLHSNGRFAALTNYRDPATPMAHGPSRGEIIPELLTSSLDLQSHLEQLATTAQAYNGFNLLAGEQTAQGVTLYWYGNRHTRVEAVPPGIHGLSNALLNTSWPKVETGKAGLKQILEAGRENNHKALFSLLADTRRPKDDALPETGVGLEWERILSPLFIRSDTYGTRSSTLVLLDRRGRFTIIERSYTTMDARNYTDRKFHMGPWGIRTLPPRSHPSTIAKNKRTRP